MFKKRSTAPAAHMAAQEDPIDSSKTTGSVNISSPANPSAPRKRSQSELLIRDLLSLLIKIVAVITCAVLLFTFMFGIYRCADPYMFPTVRDGDLIIYYRLDKLYSRSDVLVAEYQGQLLSLRVVAIAGDEVDIRENGLYVNGSLQLESGVYERTERFSEGVDFPLTVGDDQVFVLGDGRENATDSRIFGPVRTADTCGKVIAIIRRRNI